MAKVWKEGGFEARVKQVLEDEAKCPLRAFYLSFAGTEGFRGGAIVQAHGITTAVSVCNVLGINPGGEVMAVPISKDRIPAPEWSNRLLSKDDLQNLTPAAQEEKRNNA